MQAFPCPHCGQKIKVPDSAAGKRGKCPKCNHRVTVPGVGSLAPTVSDVAAPENPDPIIPEVQEFPDFHEPIPGPVQVNISASPSRAAHSLGIASLVIGILSFFVCWMPIIGIAFSGLGALMGGAGIVLAIVRKGSGIGYSIAGTAVSSVALIVGLSLTFLVGHFFESLEDARKQARLSHQEAMDELSQDAPDETEPPAPVSMGEKFRGDGFDIGVLTIFKGKPLLKSESRLSRSGFDQAKDPAIVVVLDVNNTDDRRILRYHESSLYSYFTLRDDVGNVIRRVDYGALARPLGALTTQDDILPGQQEKHWVVFSIPPPKTKHLILTVDLRAFGSEGEVEFLVPMDAIQDMPSMKGEG